MFFGYIGSGRTTSLLASVGAPRPHLTGAGRKQVTVHHAVHLLILAFTWVFNGRNHRFFTRVNGTRRDGPLHLIW